MNDILSSKAVTHPEPSHYPFPRPLSPRSAAKKQCLYTLEDRPSLRPLTKITLPKAVKSKMRTPKKSTQASAVKLRDGGTGSPVSGTRLPTVSVTTDADSGAIRMAKKVHFSSHSKGVPLIMTPFLCMLSNSLGTETCGPISNFIFWIIKFCGQIV